jgi:hypothetical protein
MEHPPGDALFSGMKSISHILIALTFLFAACTGSRKYFKAAEKLEKQGLVNEAAGYYLEALQRKPTNVDARIKVKQVGQKYVSSLASEFFRNYNTQNFEASLEVFERLKQFHGLAAALDVQLDYPSAYEEDYRKAVETYCQKNYTQAMINVNQKKCADAMPYISKVKKYNANYHNLQQIETVAICEPLYQNAIMALENHNYPLALSHLSGIRQRTESYKDAAELYELANARHTKTFILFMPKPPSDRGEKDVEEVLYNSFSQAALQKLQVKIINNTPFQSSPQATDLNNSTNIDLVQAIRKATGADYFYVFDVGERRDYNPGISKVQNAAYQQVTTMQGTVAVTDYRQVDYNVVKGQRAYSFDYKYRIINAYTNQIVASQSQNIRAQDAIEYNEFHRTFNGNINSLYPYHPARTPVINQYNPRLWRNLFSARSTLKSFDELKNEAYNQALNVFISSASYMK